MIDYGSFLFAAPPLSGAAWFVRACEFAEVRRRNPRGRDPASEVWGPFADAQGRLKVSVVRNPCDWLADLWVDQEPEGEFTSDVLNDTFTGFVHRYLRRIPGAVGRTFLGYRADTYLRIEDCPLAMVMLLLTVAPGSDYRSPFFNERVGSLGPGWPSLSLDVDLRREVIEAERTMVDEFDYR